MSGPGMIRVALTFDVEHPDRPSVPGVMEGILEVLERARVPAFCFIQGRWALAYPDVAARIAAAGMGIGSHGHHHVPVPMLSTDGLRREIREAGDAVRDATGVDPSPWFRCPFGAGQGAARTTAVLAELGYGPSVPWDVDGLDWDGPTPGELEQRVVDGVVSVAADAVVLLHSWPVPTAAALPGIVRRLRASGREFVPLAAVVSRGVERRAAVPPRRG